MLNLYMRVFESSPPHSAAPGLPVFPLDQPVAEEALNASIAQVNLLSRGPNIYGITRSIIKKVIPVEEKAYDMILNFNIRETVCLKESGKDSDVCDFEMGRFARTAACSSRVQFRNDQIDNVSVRCSSSGSSSSSSSESMSSSSEELMSQHLNGRRQYTYRGAVEFQNAILEKHYDKVNQHDLQPQYVAI
ncbi:Secreted phosphoprotein 24 [Acipenser ruthenus]|uniref:Secreted phosphoprotein 24 n=1 Tax=Acipenser ruthenus TaxID=7906 RepID=A0A444UAA5_ACIRT|nr:Secreted phosphoprotein 24 [Acipenser ruthenus]